MTLWENDFRRCRPSDYEVGAAGAVYASDSVTSSAVMSSAARWYAVHVTALCPGVTATASRTAVDVPPWLVQSPEDVVRPGAKSAGPQ
ncbi:hypothetical protein [Nocardia nova]|uniref:hypothetical protein n=1 Tax=Nocardia nova TaxID=37330 RepID=UPI0015E2BC94|nr:hypothetical protein [Nocardia nova]